MPAKQTSQESAGDYFGALAADYDSQIRRGLPRYEEMLSHLVECLPESAADFLELGCGTGALSTRIAKRFPDVKLTMVDAASEMIEIARARLSAANRGVSSRARFIHSPFEELRLDNAQFDCVTASMSLHHIVDKEPFYRRLRDSLRDGGVLVFADELTGAVPHIQRLHRDAWLDFSRRPGHLTEDELEGMYRRELEHEHYETLPRQLELLAATGFRSVDCAWRYLNYAIFVAAS